LRLGSRQSFSTLDSVVGLAVLTPGSVRTLIRFAFTTVVFVLLLDPALQTMKGLSSRVEPLT
jgi:hypothetical protein